MAALFETTVAEWGPFYAELYKDLVKIKFHHLVAHLHDDLARIGKVIGCFATERKHKDLKRHVLHVFRHVEYTTTVGYLNAWCQSIISGSFHYNPRFLIKPQCLPRLGVKFSSKAELEIGYVELGDIVQTSRGGIQYVAEVQRFFSLDQHDDSDVQVWLKAYRRLSIDTTFGSVVSEWDAAAPESVLLHASMIDGTLVWARRRRDVIVVIELPQ